MRTASSSSTDGSSRHHHLGCRRGGLAGGTLARCEHDRAGRVQVGVDLSVPGHPDIFVVGDTAAVTDQPGIPGIAPAAKQMGRYVGRLIAARVARGRHRRHSVSSSGRSRHHRPARGGGEPRPAQADRLPRLAVLERGAHLFPDRVRDRFIVAFTWLWDYLTFQRGARLITEVPPAERK